MFLERFHSIQQGQVRISAPQASQFAREVAGDFNPIHNSDARRFCVPGDLLFAIVLWRFGLYRNMTFQFRSLLGDGIALNFREEGDGAIRVCDDAGKTYLEVSRSGERTDDKTVIENFTRCYVAASGKNFPHTLKPLMEANKVMFNPERPMVIYESMSLALDRLDAPNPSLDLRDSRMDVEGKRGRVLLDFRLSSGNEAIGTVSKRLVVTGLRPYDPVAMDQVVTEFYRLKDGS